MTSALDRFVSELDEVDELAIERDSPAGALSTYRVGGPISVLVRIESHGALTALVAACSRHSVVTLPIGKGSNLLVSDAGFEGVGLVLGDAFSDVSFDGTTMVAGAGASLPVTARASVSAGLSGFEWAVGVPGSIGGAVRMNAGGHGSDMAANLVSVEIADLSLQGGMRHVATSDLDLRYRASNLLPTHLVVSATLELAPGDTETGTSSLKEIVSWRRENQPGGANAGSVFTNPPNDSAGRLIDVAGLKGRRIGSAEVSTKHANFIQADPDGSADDVMALMIEIVDRVEKHSGIRLHAETRLVGFGEERIARVQSPNHGDVPQTDVGNDSTQDEATPGGSAAHG